MLYKKLRKMIWMIACRRGNIGAFDIIAIVLLNKADRRFKPFIDLGKWAVFLSRSISKISPFKIADSFSEK